MSLKCSNPKFIINYGLKEDMTTIFKVFMVKTKSTTSIYAYLDVGLDDVLDVMTGRDVDGGLLLDVVVGTSLSYDKITSWNKIKTWEGKTKKSHIYINIYNLCLPNSITHKTVDMVDINVD